jgi:diguanylate cyclase (GGDEF)-like protein
MNPKKRKPAPEADVFPSSERWGVERAMSHRPLTVDENATVWDVCSLMKQHSSGQVFVVAKGTRLAPGELPPEPVGVFTERDLIRLVVEHPEQVSTMKMSQAMTGPVMSLDVGEDLQHAYNLMILLRVRRLPILEKGRLVGVVTRGRVMEAQRQRLVEMETENQELEEQLVHDPLTGLANRVLFEKVIEREIAHVERHGGYVGILMIDIDHFKRVNDTYGHPVGDVVLRQVTGLLRDTVRRADLLARIGGEEFAVIVSQKSRPDLKKLGDKLRLRIAGESYGEGRERFPVTISIGAKFYDKKMAGRSGLMKAADKNLYQAKQTGRNKVVGP